MRQQFCDHIQSLINLKHYIQFTKYNTDTNTFNFNFNMYYFKVKMIYNKEISQVNVRFHSVWQCQVKEYWTGIFNEQLVFNLLWEYSLPDWRHESRDTLELYKPCLHVVHTGTLGWIPWTYRTYPRPRFIAPNILLRKCFMI